VQKAHFELRRKVKKVCFLKHILL